MASLLTTLTLFPVDSTSQHTCLLHMFKSYVTNTWQQCDKISANFAYLRHRQNNPKTKHIHTTATW